MVVTTCPLSDPADLTDMHIFSDIVSHLSCLTLRQRWGNLATISAPSRCTFVKPGQTTHGGRLQLEFFKAALFILECFTQSFFFTCFLCCHCRTNKPFIIFEHKKWPSSLSPASCSLPATALCTFKTIGIFLEVELVATKWAITHRSLKRGWLT